MLKTSALSRLLILTLSASVLSGCAMFRPTDPVDEARGWSESKIYKRAAREMQAFNYDEAAELLERLDAQYPNSTYAQQGTLDLAYAYYKGQKTDLAIATSERFIKQYPNHPNVDYAYYIRAIANFDRGYGFIAKLFPPDPAKTDQSNALDSFRYFAELVERFPTSRYAPDSRKRMSFIRNNLAKYEALVANHYLERGAYPAALNRSKTVLQNFQSAPAAKAALAIMVEAYVQMGMSNLAQDTMAVLQQTYPQDAFTARSYKVYTTKQPADSMEKMIERLQ